MNRPFGRAINCATTNKIQRSMEFDLKRGTVPRLRGLLENHHFAGSGIIPGG